jgi:hypothetical protein
MIFLPTPEELRQFQIEHYTELMNNPRSFEQKIFLRKQIYQLKKLTLYGIRNNHNGNNNRIGLVCS